MERVDKLKVKQAETFYAAIRNEMSIILATSANNSVTMRYVSPVYYHGNILIFTDASSKKYMQMKENPNCCLFAGGFFATATAEFFGSTMLDANEAMRAAYTAKFPGAFDEGVALGGRNAEFILLRPVKLSGWTFENDIPTADGSPNLPFEIEL